MLKLKTGVIIASVLVMLGIIGLILQNPIPETIENMKTSQLLECSREPGNIIECSEGFICYEERSGGLGPPGMDIPNESIGGDKLCHQECVTNDDCPSHAPVCIFTSRSTEDYTEGFYLCFEDDN